MSSSTRSRPAKSQEPPAAAKSRKAMKVSELLRHNISSLLDQPQSPLPLPPVKPVAQPFLTPEHPSALCNTDSAVEAPEPAVPGSFPHEPQASPEAYTLQPINATSRSRPVSLDTRGQTALVAAARPPRPVGPAAHIHIPDTAVVSRRAASHSTLAPATASTAVAQYTPFEPAPVPPPALEHTIANTVDLSTHHSTTINGPVYISRPPASPPATSLESNPPRSSSASSWSWATAVYQSLCALAPAPAPALWPPAPTALPAFFTGGGPYPFLGGGLALALAGLSLAWAQPLWTAYHAQHDVCAAASAVHGWASAAGALVRDAFAWTGMVAATVTAAPPAATGMDSAAAGTHSASAAQTGLRLPLQAGRTYASSLAPATAAFVDSLHFFLANWGPRLPGVVAALLAGLPALVGVAAVPGGAPGGDTTAVAPHGLAAVPHALEQVLSRGAAYPAAMGAALGRDLERGAALCRRLEGASAGAVADARAGGWLRRLGARLRHGSGGLLGSCPDEAGCAWEGLLRAEARARIRAFQEVLGAALRARSEVHDGLVDVEGLTAQVADPLCNAADVLGEAYGAVRRTANDGGEGERGAAGGAGLAFDLDNLAKIGLLHCDAVRLVVLELERSGVLDLLRAEMAEIRAALAWAAGQHVGSPGTLLAGGSRESMLYEAENLDRELAARLQRWMDAVGEYYYAARAES